MRPDRTDIPVLETARLRLRAPDATDAGAYAAFFGDAEASAFYGGPLGPVAAWNRLAADLGHWMLRGHGVWIIDPRDGQGAAGTCGIAWPEGWPRPELTWWVAPQHRRRGYAREASKAVIAWAQHAGWAQVETHMKDENLAARSLVASLGGVRIARERFPDGVDRDVFALPWS